MSAHTRAVLDVIEERRRQVEHLGYGAAHDDAHEAGDLAAAAFSYAGHAAISLSGGEPGGVPRSWPFESQYWRPSTPRRDLVRAAALILAEIERLDRQGGAA